MTRDDGFQFSQRSRKTGDERKFERTLNLDGNATKGIFEYAKHFLPMVFLRDMAILMMAKGKAKHTEGKSDYEHWEVTLDDVLQWIGIWMYMLALGAPPP